MSSAGETRVAEIRRRLEAAVSPSHLEVADQSHLHAGHAGARDGRGHFRVVIEADAFSGHSAIERHRLVYDALADMMRTDIHALSIQASAPAHL